MTEEDKLKRLEELEKYQNRRDEIRKWQAGIMMVVLFIIVLAGV